MILGIFVYYLISFLHVSIWYIFLTGILSGIFFGKVFCRWACPVGLIMEIMMSLYRDEKVKAIYQYHKAGCPIAWISGFLNKFSIFKIRNEVSERRSCGICDKTCYVTLMQPEKYSLYKEGMQRPGDSYMCSRCLQCVLACPAGNIKFDLKKFSY